MKDQMLLSEVMHQLVLNDPKDTYAQLLRRCPFIMIGMLRKGYMTWDELTPEERKRLQPFISEKEVPND